MLTSKLTVMPFSRMSEVPAGGTGMSALPCASMSHQTVVPSCSYTLPDWSQRRMRVCRLGSGLPGGKPAPSVVASVMVFAAKSMVSIWCNSPWVWPELRGIVENLDPVARGEAQHLIASETLHRELARGIAGAVGRVRDARHAGDDRAVVARPFESAIRARFAGGPRSSGVPGW